MFIMLMYANNSDEEYMGEDNTKRKIKIKPFKSKWYSFIITYLIFNIYFYISNNSIINNLYSNFSNLYHKDVMFDGADFSIFANLLATPIFVFLLAANVGIALVFEFIAILLFKIAYMKSVVKQEDKVRLLKYIRAAILSFIVANMVGMVFWLDVYRAVLYIFLYMPIPLFTLILIYLKIKKHELIEI